MLKSCAMGHHGTKRERGVVRQREGDRDRPDRDGGWRRGSRGGERLGKDVREKWV